MQKKSPAIYMTGTNVFIRGTTQFRARPATFLLFFLFYDVFNSLWHTLVQPTTHCLVLKGNKKTLLFQFFISSATSFDTFVDFSAPPLSVKCGIQNTSDEPILSPFKRKINNFSHPKARLAGREILCPPDSWRISPKGTGRHLDDFHSE